MCRYSGGDVISSARSAYTIPRRRVCLTTYSGNVTKVRSTEKVAQAHLSSSSLSEFNFFYSLHHRTLLFALFSHIRQRYEDVSTSEEGGDKVTTCIRPTFILLPFLSCISYDNTDGYHWTRQLGR